jgi:hypothetical protein
MFAFFQKILIIENICSALRMGILGESWFFVVFPGFLVVDVCAWLFKGNVL